jgi:hypothetical protein
MDEGIEFFRTFSETDYQARHAMHADPDDERFLALARALDEMFEDGLQPDLRRALNRRASQYTKPDYVEAAARQQRRPVFAVARYQHVNIDLWSAWMGSPEIDPRGDGITENLYTVRDALGRFKIQSIYRICDCLGAGSRCTSCFGNPWRCHLGTVWITPWSGLREVRMLRQPSDPRYQAAYDAIRLLDRRAARIN